MPLPPNRVLPANIPLDSRRAQAGEIDDLDIQFRRDAIG
jgi:hypothetical protein